MADWSRRGSVDPVAVEALPGWLADLAGQVAQLRAADLSPFLPPHGQGRHSAVLILFSSDHELLLIRRANTMRSHAGQPAFPGGALDAEDADARAAALREAREETGLDPSGVLVFGELPDLWLPISDFVVTPVLAWWRTPSPVRAQDPAELASVHRIPIEVLADPANRRRVVHPSGYIGAAFAVEGMLVWGFTGGIIAGLLTRLGWPADHFEAPLVELPQGTPDP